MQSVSVPLGNKILGNTLTRQQLKRQTRILLPKTGNTYWMRCDKVQGNDNGPKEAVAAMIKRLAHRNANVQLYTLELGECSLTELWRRHASRIGV